MKRQYIRNKNNERAKNIKQKEGKESQKSWEKKERLGGTDLVGLW